MIPGQDVPPSGFLTALIMIFLALPQFFNQLCKVLQIIIKPLKRCVDVYECTKEIEELPEQTTVCLTVIEFILFILKLLVQISKLLVGISFFVMNYFITECIKPLKETNEGICKHFGKTRNQEKWFIYRLTQESSCVESKFEGFYNDWSYVTYGTPLRRECMTNYEYFAVIATSFMLFLALCLVVNLSFFDLEPRNNVRKIFQKSENSKKEMLKDYEKQPFNVTK